MNKNALSSRFAISAIIAGGLLFFGGYFIGNYNSTHSAPASVINAQMATASTTADFAPFWKAWDLLNKKFVASDKPISDQDKVYGAIQGLAAAYGDPYTTFFPPEEAKNFNDQISGSFEGVGMELGVKDGILTVISPIKGNPAALAGVLAGDKIIKINASSTQSMSTDEAIKLIRGPKGTKVTITVVRKDIKNPIDITITRDIVAVPTVDTQTKPGNIFVISIYTFSVNSADLFRDALRKFVESGSHKLVLDLRGNPGGYLDAAVDMASWFLPLGKPVVSENYGANSNTQPDIYNSHGYNIFGKDLKMVVLIDGGSASASEILTGALQDYGIATVVGEQSFGKGSVQELVPLTSNTSLKVTVAHWFTPKGRSISKVGITPDIIVPITDKDIATKNDAQMNKALEILGQSQ